MKVLFTLSFLFGSMALATPNFGAFTDSNRLYITILGDCNTASAGLVVDPLCNKNRLTRNYVVECGAELVVATTRMICPDGEIIPKVFTFDLNKEPVAPEALELEIKYQTQTVKMKINR